MLTACLIIIVIQITISYSDQSNYLKELLKYLMIAETPQIFFIFETETIMIQDSLSLHIRKFNLHIKRISLINLDVAYF